jgi:hypothetical protein
MIWVCFPSPLEVSLTTRLTRTLAAEKGTVLFGGYDTDKYQGTLAVLDIQPAEEGLISRMLVIWSSIGVTDAKGSVIIPTASTPQSVLLDSGTALTVVPQDVFTSLANYFGAVLNNRLGTYIVPCNLGYGTLDFGFGDASGPVISVPFSELALPITDNQGNVVTYDDGSLVCQLGLDIAQDSLGIILGDTFLRSAYVVYDLGRKQIGIAQTRFNVTTSNIKSIPATGGNLAGASSIVASGTTLSYAATAAATVQQAPDGGALTRTATGRAGGKTVAATAASGTIAGGIKTTYTNRATDIPGATSSKAGANGASTSASTSTSTSSSKPSSANGLIDRSKFGAWSAALLVMLTIGLGVTPLTRWVV